MMMHVDVTFSLPVLFKQRKIPLPLVCKRLPAYAEILESTLMRFVKPSFLKILSLIE